MRTRFTREEAERSRVTGRYVSLDVSAPLDPRPVTRDPSQASLSLALAHSHARTLGGGERAVLEVGKRLSPRHRLRLLLGGFSPGSTYPELAALPHTRLGRLDWLTSR